MNTIAENFENWQSELEELQKNVKKDLEEIKRCKMEVQSMKNNLTDTLGELK
jgi:peptidoglycan hydrolase CwlO-like protein